MFKYFILLIIPSLLLAQKRIDPKLTEVWEPIPDMVVPGENNAPPSDAIILFDGSNLSKWVNARTGGPAGWILNSDGSMTVKPDGGIQTKDEFGSVQFHIEWKTPKEIKGTGQGRGNSGVTFQRRFEIQILDSFNNQTYPNGQAASLYKQYIPLVNASRPPGIWQEYDICKGFLKKSLIFLLKPTFFSPNLLFFKHLQRLAIFNNKMCKNPLKIRIKNSCLQT